MSIEKTRAQVMTAIWQGIAQSGVDISVLTQEQQQKLFGKITDNVMLAMDAILEETQPAPIDEIKDENGMAEKVLWQGRPFLSLVERYIITNERLKIVKGMVSRDVENFELIRLQDIDLSQGVGERMLGIGDISIRGADASQPAVVLRNIPKPEEVYEILRRAWLEARKRHGLQFREYM
jgi:hypothetical protein